MTEQDGKRKISRRAGDADVLGLAEGLASSLGKSVDRSDLETLRTVAESYPDVGADGGGAVVESLTGLLKDFLDTGAYDRDAILVHIRAWRFVVSRKPDARERAAVMQGLADVRSLYRIADAA